MIPRNISKLAREEFFLEEKKVLVDKVITTFENYKNMLYSEIEMLNEHNYNFIVNDFEMPILLSSHVNLLNTNVNQYTNKNKNEVLANHLEFIKNEGYSHIKKLIDSKDKFISISYDYAFALQDLIHFYKVSGKFSKEFFKTRKLNKCVVPITDGWSEKADLKPLNELEKAIEDIKMFRDTENFKYIERLIIKDKQGKAEIDNDGHYIINSYYFIDRVKGLENNLREKYIMNAKAVEKITKWHSTNTRLRNYLLFGE